jgi:hypothetical protein
MDMHGMLSEVVHKIFNLCNFMINPKFELLSNVSGRDGDQSSSCPSCGTTRWKEANQGMFAAEAFQFASVF